MWGREAGCGGGRRGSTSGSALPFHARKGAGWPIARLGGSARWVLIGWRRAGGGVGRAGRGAAGAAPQSRRSAGRAGSGRCCRRRCRARMRLRSGVFASSCLLVQALGVALFLRGFFPVPVRSVPRREARAEPPAEPAPPGPGNVPVRRCPGNSLCSALVFPDRFPE